MRIATPRRSPRRRAARERPARSSRRDTSAAALPRRREERRRRRRRGRRSAALEAVLLARLDGAPQCGQLSLPLHGGRASLACGRAVSSRRSARRSGAGARSCGQRRALCRPGAAVARRSASPRRCGAPHSQRADGRRAAGRRRPRAARRAREALLERRQLDAAARRAGPARNWSRRYISSISPPRSRIRSSRTASSAAAPAGAGPAAGARLRGRRRVEQAGAASASVGARREERADTRESSGGRLSFRKPAKLDDDEPLLGHLAHGVGGAFARVAGGLDAAVGHLVGAEGRRLVDDDAAELEPRRGASAVVEVGGEDRRPAGRSACRSRARSPRRASRTASTRHDRAEDLLARDLRRRRGGSRSRSGGSARRRRLAAGEDLARGAPRRSTRGSRSRASSSITGPTSVSSSAGSPTLSASTFGTNSLHERVADVACDVDALHGDAALAGERERVRGELRRGVVDVGVRARRSPASRCRARALTRLRGARSRQLPADVARAGEGDQPSTRSSPTSTSPISRRGPDDDVQPARRQAGLLLELRQQQRRERRLRSPASARPRSPPRARARSCARRGCSGKLNGLIAPTTPIGMRSVKRELALARLRGVHRHHLARELARLDGREGVGRHRARRPRRAPPSSACRPRRRSCRATSSCRRPSCAGDLDEDLRALVRRQRLAHRAARRRRRRAAPRRRRPSRPGRRPRPEYGERTSIQSPVSTHSPSTKASVRSAWSAMMQVYGGRS